MAFPFSGKKERFKRNFSDADIDDFVSFLKANHMTMTLEDAQAALHSQTHDDPRRLREKKLPKALLISESSALYHLWDEWEDAEKTAFEPLEFMGERIEEAHEICIRNRVALESGTTDSEAQSVVERRDELSRKDKRLESLDENQKEILNFESELERVGEKIYNKVLRCRTILSTRKIDELSKEVKKNTVEVTEDISNLRALGGFTNKEEAERALNEFAESSAQTDDETKDVAETQDELAPANAHICFRITENKIRAWLFIFPPRNGGADITEEELKAFLEMNGIKYGVDTYLIRKIVEKKYYFKLMQIATGLDVLHGNNGVVEEMIEREKRVNLKEDVHGNVNYKELNIISSVCKGDTICHVKLPTKSRDGRTVTDEIVKGKDGKYPTIPKGRNTQLNEDGSRLLSMIDGEVVYENGQFRVQKLLNIPSDVDNSVGNIDFPGDVVVNGDIREGFSVHAGGRLYVKGTVEAAKLSAGSELVIERGMTGGQKGTIECGGTLRCKFLEGCKVYAKGTIYADNIVFSEVACDDSVVVTGERGSISGGKITAAKTVTTRTLGSRNNSGLTTRIVLGCTPHMLEQQFNLQKKQENIDSNISKLQQNIKYIESGGERSSEERKTMLQQLKIQLQMRMLQKAQVDKQLATLTSELFHNNTKCELICDHLYPSVVVTIADQTLTIKTEENFCKILMHENEIVVDNQ